MLSSMADKDMSMTLLGSLALAAALQSRTNTALWYGGRPSLRRAQPYIVSSPLAG